MRIMLKSKIYYATVTDAELYYRGSITIDETLMETADLRAGEKVEVLNLNNGSRLETYVIEAPAGSGTIALNGAAARKGNKGDLIIIIAYGHFHKDELKDFQPQVVHVDSDNKPTNL